MSIAAVAVSSNGVESETARRTCKVPDDGFVAVREGKTDSCRLKGVGGIRQLKMSSKIANTSDAACSGFMIVFACTVLTVA